MKKKYVCGCVSKKYWKYLMFIIDCVCINVYIVFWEDFFKEEIYIVGWKRLCIWEILF